MLNDYIQLLDSDGVNHELDESSIFTKYSVAQYVEIEIFFNFLALFVKLKTLFFNQSN